MKNAADPFGVSQISSKRIIALDGLRGIAVIMVLIWHLLGSTLGGRSEFGDYVYSFTIFGRTGVDLFFVLSGFLIIGILLDKRDSENLFRVFYLRRVLRIFPPYLILILVYWSCYLLLGETDAFNTRYGFWTQLGSQLSFTWNLLMARFDEGIARGFSVTWSVAIEEHFYLVFPFLLFLTPRRHIWKLLLSIAIFSATLRGAFFLWKPEYSLFPYIVTPLRLDGLCYGGLVAVACRRPGTREWLAEHRNAIMLMSLALAVPIPFVISAIQSNLLENMYLWGHTYLGLTYAIMVAAIILNNDRFRILESPALTFFGKISYSLYLFHPLFLSLFFVLTGRQEAIYTWIDAAIVLSSFVATLGFCMVLYRFVETPARSYGHNQGYRLGVR